MSSKREVVIVGAGAVGCSIAYHLAKQGVPSQIIEREAVAARASGKAWAVFPYPPRFIALEGQPGDLLFSMPTGSVRPWLDLVWSGYHRLPDLALELEEATGIDIGFGELSWVRLALTEEQEAAGRALLAVQQGQGYHEGYWIDAGDLKELFPGLSPEVRGGVVFPYLQIEPYRYTLGLAQAAEQRGARIRQGEVVGFRRQGARVTAAVLASGTEVMADTFVLATGPWTRQSASWVGPEMPIVVNREQCVRMEPEKRLPPFGLAAPSGLSIIPKVDGDVIVGHAALPDLHADPTGDLTTEEGKMHLLTDVAELLPALGDARLVEHRGDFEGWAPAPKRIQPVLGRLPGADNVYVAARFGTLGMTMSLGAGRLMADLILAADRPLVRFRHVAEVLSPADR